MLNVCVGFWVNDVGASLNDHDQFVGMHDVEIVAQQLAGKVAVGIPRIEQRNAVPEFVAFDRKPLHFGLTFGQQAIVIAPRKEPAWADQRQRPQHQQANQGPTLSKLVSRQLGFVTPLVHSHIGITIESSVQGEFRKTCVKKTSHQHMVCLMTYRP